MRPQKREEEKLMESFHVRLRRDQAEAIRAISKELNQSLSETVRDLITIALMIQDAADRITFKDILFALSEEFVKTPYGFFWGLERFERLKKERERERHAEGKAEGDRS